MHASRVIRAGDAVSEADEAQRQQTLRQQQARKQAVKAARQHHSAGLSSSATWHKT